MKIIKELYDNKKNVALIINPAYEPDNHLSDVTSYKEMKIKCLQHIFKKYFRKPKTFYEELTINELVDFTLRWVSYNLVLCYFNTEYSEHFENKIVQAVNIAAIDEDQSDLKPNDPLFQFRKYGLSIFSDDMRNAPFVWEKIDTKNLIWSK